MGGCNIGKQREQGGGTVQSMIKRGKAQLEGLHVRGRAKGREKSNVLRRTGGTYRNPQSKRKELKGPGRNERKLKRKWGCSPPPIRTLREKSTGQMEGQGNKFPITKSKRKEHEQRVGCASRGYDRTTMGETALGTQIAKSVKTVRKAKRRDHRTVKRKAPGAPRCVTP